MTAAHFADDSHHPLHGPWWSAIGQSWAYLDQGWPQASAALWPGRGVAGEIGARAYHDLVARPELFDEEHERRRRWLSGSHVNRTNWTDGLQSEVETAERTIAAAVANTGQMAP